MPRRYQMRVRAASAAATRARILEAAHRLLARPGGGALALHEVAEAAGVTRATIYKSLGGRPALLAAVFEDQGRLIGFERVRGAMQRPDPMEAVVATVRECCRAWGVMPEALRRTLALAALDPEIGAAVERYERYRQAEMGAVARRAWRAGHRARGVRGKDAAAAFAVITSFSAFDQLRLTHGIAAATSHLVRVARTMFGESTSEG